MAALNNVQLIGRLGKNPEVKNLDNGNTVANFTLAITEGYKDKATGEKKQHVEWINIVLWKGLADLAGRFLHKGDLIYLTGKLRTRQYESNNTTKYITEVVGDTMQMLGKSKPASPAQTAGGYSAPSDNSTDDLQF